MVDRASHSAPPPRYLLVDGHSIIHAWEDLRKLHSRGASRYLAREELRKRMRLLQDMTAQRVVLVFDGTGERLTEEREDDGIQVFYADAAQSADSVIERLAARYARQFQIRVCTADRMIWETVRAFEAHWISPDDLRFEFEKAEAEMRDRINY